MKHWFISDIHLKSANERSGKILLRFLHSLQAEDVHSTQLFLLGDIFDLWVGDHEVFQKQFEPIILELQKLKNAGMQIFFFEGNHDLHIENFFTKVLGIPVYTSAQIFDLNGLKVQIEHGDEMNLEDLAYLRLRAFLRSRPLKFFGQNLPGRFWSFVGRKASQTSRKFSSQYREDKEKQIRQVIRQHARRLQAQNPNINAVISGHMHVWDDYSVEEAGQILRSINLGSWLGTEIKALKLEGQSWQWVTLTE